jgi:hypothetical protein
MEALAQYAARFAGLQADTFFPAGNDLESYYLKRDHIAAACGISPEIADNILEGAFNARRSELTAKYVNTVVENQRRAGQRPNSGDIAVQCAATLTGPTCASVHGKTLLKAVRDELRARGIADRLQSLSDHLRVNELAAFRGPLNVNSL